MSSFTRRAARNGMRLAAVALGGLFAAHLSVAPAAAAEPGAPETYEASFFMPYSPQTALDMVQHLPGFRLDTGDESVRGFSEAGGNVLVDGQRPVAKSGGLAAALSAIPAPQVARIEVVRGGVAASETSGQTIIANIVRIARKQSLATSAALSIMDRHAFGTASLTETRSLGRFDLSSNTTFDAQGESSHGSRAQFAPGGSRIGSDGLAYQTYFPELSERVALGGALAGGRLSASAMLAHARLAEAFTFTDDTTLDRVPKYTGRWRGEASADWVRGVADGVALKLLALANFIDLDASSSDQTGPAKADLEATDLFHSKSTSRETILRATAAKVGDAAFRPEVGAEASWNRLDSRSTFETFGAGEVPVSVSPAHVLVSEVRLEAFATLNWRPSPRWAVAAGASYETSEIRARGDAARTNRFGFLKPNLSISYKPDARSDVRLSVRRTVGQLSFADFAASANLAEGTASGGNPDLGPDHKTTASLDYDRRFGKRGAFNLSAFYDWRGDVLEAAVLPSGAFGVVNAGSARVWSVAANVELPTDPIVHGGLFKLSYGRLGSRVLDPVTHVWRDINNTHPSDLAASFRQDLDIAKTSWGLDFTRGFHHRFWWADEAREQLHSSVFGLFIETSRFFDAKVRLEANGLTGTRNTFSRLLYTPDRSGALNQREIWDIKTPAAVTLSISRSF